MTKVFEAAGYIIHDNEGYAIHGTGATADEAWAEVLHYSAPFYDTHGNEISAKEARYTMFKTYEASQALLYQVAEDGGDIAWGMVDGIACTVEEEESAQDE